VVGDRGDDENPQGDADSRQRCANIEEWIWESRNLKVMVGKGQWRTFRKMQSETKVRNHMGRTLWWLATEMMEKLLGDAFHGRTMCEGRSSGFERGKNRTIGDG
jgi:hypothetical protein